MWPKVLCRRWDTIAIAIIIIGAGTVPIASTATHTTSRRMATTCVSTTGNTTIIITATIRGGTITTTKRVM
jgi:hypothetical protein